MRTIALATFCTLCALAALPAQAQQVNRIKATGANAAGACAGSLELVGDSMSRVQNVDPRKLADVQQARNFFADMPRYPASEIAAAANAFIGLMVGRLQKATTAEERQAIEREIVQVSAKCRSSAIAAIRASRNAAGVQPPATTGTAQPYVAPPAAVQPTLPYVAQPSPVQPYVVQPSTVQPYTTQPLILDPVVPSQ